MNSPTYSNWILTSAVLKLQMQVKELNMVVDDLYKKLESYKTYNMSAAQFGTGKILCKCHSCKKARNEGHYL